MLRSSDVVDSCRIGRVSWWRMQCIACHSAVLICGVTALAQPELPVEPTDEPRRNASHTTPANGEESSKRQAEREAALARMLSGATLEGSFTVTDPGRDPAKLAREKYTLGDVRKLAGRLWLFPTRIEYGEHDVTLPITVPIEWAGDTPVVVVDNVGLPVFGTVSARVMFFADHYAGYWKHGDAGGHLFGVIHRARRPDAGSDASAQSGDDHQD